MSKIKALITLAILFCGYEPVQPTPPLATPQATTTIGDTPIEPFLPDSAPEVTRDPPTAGSEITGKVVGIVDGDTIDVLTAEKKTIRIRLNGIDAPEKGQPFGNTAKEFLSVSIGGFDVRVVTHGQDRYGRTIGDVYSLKDSDGLERVSSVNVTMVTNGLAWHYLKYTPDRQDLADSESWAREKKLRLWSDARRVAPWDWRQLSKVERDRLR